MAVRSSSYLNKLKALYFLFSFFEKRKIIIAKIRTLLLLRRCTTCRRRRLLQYLPQDYLYLILCSLLSTKLGQIKRDRQAHRI